MICDINGGGLRIELKTLGGCAESAGIERFTNITCAEYLGGNGIK
jgi:hypothetical protein